jgi:hypothetical protein
MDLGDELTHHAPKIGFSEKTLIDQGRQRISHQTPLKIHPAFVKKPDYNEAYDLN